MLLGLNCTSLNAIKLISPSLCCCSGSVKKCFMALCRSRSAGSHTCRNTSCPWATKAKRLHLLHLWQLLLSSIQSLCSPKVFMKFTLNQVNIFKRHGRVRKSLCLIEAIHCQLKKCKNCPREGRHEPYEDSSRT